MADRDRRLTKTDWRQNMAHKCRLRQKMTDKDIYGDRKLLTKIDLDRK